MSVSSVLMKRSAIRVNDKYVLLMFSCLLALAVYWQRLVTNVEEGRILLAGGVGAAEFIGLFALCLTAWRIGSDRVLSRADLFLICGVSIVLVVPSMNVAAVPLLFLALTLAWRSDPRTASFGQILLALLFFEVFGRLFFYLVSPLVLSFEAKLVSMLLSFFGDFKHNGLNITAANGHAIMIETGCSAFHNVSTATLLWLSLIKIEKANIHLRDWLVLLAMVALTILANTIRIALMAQSYPMYEYWHNGDGVGIFSLSLLASMLGLFLGARYIDGWVPSERTAQ